MRRVMDFKIFWPSKDAWEHTFKPSPLMGEGLGGGDVAANPRRLAQIWPSLCQRHFLVFPQSGSHFGFMDRASSPPNPPPSRGRARYFACLLLLLAGCQNAGPPLLQPLPAPPAGEEGTASPRTNGAVAVRRTVPTVAEVSEGISAAIRSSSPAGPEAGGGDVTLDFADTDIRAVVQQILGRILKVDYAIDPAVHGTVTFKTARPLAHAAVLPTLEALLGQNGAILVRSNDLYRVVPAAAGQAGPALGGVASAGTEVVPLRYTSAVDLAKVLTPVVGQGNAGQGNGAPGAAGQAVTRIVPDPVHNAILVTGDSAARATIQSLIRSFDVDALAGRSYALFPVPSAEEPRRVAAQLREVFQTEGDGGLAGVVRIIPMDAADAVLVVAPEPRFIDDARRLFRLLDKTRETTARNWHVYYVQNGESADLANVLQQAFTPNSVTEHGGSNAQGLGSIAPGQSLAQMNSGSGTGSTGGTTGSGGSGSGLTGGSPGGTTTSGSGPAGGSGGTAGGTVSAAATQSLSAGGETGGEAGAESRDQIRIIANHVNNAVLIYATPEEQGTIEAMLRKIDILPLQVRIDAAIAEVTLNDELKYGTQFYLKNGGVNGLLSNVAGATPSTLAGSLPGFVLNAGKLGSAQLVLSALSDVTNVRVLSSPQIMVLDNQPARLLVGNLVPYQTQSAQSTVTAGAPIVASINYRETGVILDVVPRVNKGGLVTLDLSQEVSQVQSSASVGGIESPTFTDRAVRSRIVVQDGQTVGLAGLISDTDSQENSGLPFLKDIPGLGSLFSTQTNNRTRIELVVLITPHVIEDQRAARALTEDMRRNLRDAALVPQQLDVLPPSGSSNPNASLLE